MPKFIAIYGKGGIGKSTITSHIAACFRKRKLGVLQVGCDPKHDSTFSVTGKIISTVAEVLLQHNFHSEDVRSQEIIHSGYGGICAVELGGPPAGAGCGGYIIGEGIKLLSNLNAWNDFDIVLFDVLGDIVCGGFSVPLQYSQYVAIVATDDFDSVYAANRITLAIREKSKMYPVHLCGIIGNKCSSEFLLKKFCEEINTSLIATVNYSEDIKQARLLGKTIFQLKEEGKTDISAVLFEAYERIIDSFLNEPERSKQQVSPLQDREMFIRYMGKKYFE